MDKPLKYGSRKTTKDLTFYLRVQYRCNSSWQGTIQWLDGRKSVTFRSVLELANLINDAKLQAAGQESNKGLLKKEWVDKDIVS